MNIWEFRQYMLHTFVRGYLTEVNLGKLRNLVLRVAHLLHGMMKPVLEAAPALDAATLQLVLQRFQADFLVCAVYLFLFFLSCVSQCARLCVSI